MKRYTLFALLIIATSCSIFKKEKTKTETSPVPEVTTTEVITPVKTSIRTTDLVGKSYGYSEQFSTYNAGHFVQFITDTTATILLGGDVMEIAMYYIKNDSIIVETPLTKHSEGFLYKNTELIDRIGKVWKRK